MEKMTYGKALAIAIEVVEEGEVRDKLTALKESIEKKNSKGKKPTATQKANEVLKDEILNSMEKGVGYTVSELMKNITSLNDVSNQKTSALMKQLTDNGKVSREKVRGRTYFTKVE